MVVSLFTHPMMQMIATTRFFGEGHRFSGLNPSLLGAASYQGRGRFVRSENVAAGKAASSANEAARRQSIAERKRADAGGTDADEKKGDN